MLRQFKIFNRCYAKAAGNENSIKTKLKALADQDVIESDIHARFLERTVGGAYRKWSALLQKHPELKLLKRKDIINTNETLKALNFTHNDIFSKPMVLQTNYITLENRHKVLCECGFQQITLAAVFKYITVINRPPALLKNFNYIPKDVNVVEKLRTTFTDIDLELAKDAILNENMHLKQLRETVFGQYLKQRIGASNADLEKIWRVYGRVRHKSFQSVQNMLKLLQELNFCNERIIKNGFVLYGDPDNVRRIINEVKAIDGQDIREIIYKRPKILMSPCDSLLMTLEHVRSYGISEGAILRCLEVLTLGPDTVLERLRDLHEIEEFQVLGSNPRILRLVHYQNKARLRLEYLNQLKVRCASLHILSCGSENFVKFAREGSDRTKGCDIVVYLSHKLDRNEQELRSILNRHPNWCHIPLVHVKHCYEFLLKKKFTNKNISRNVHMLLYPIARIEEKLQQIQSTEFLLQLQPNITNVYELSNDEILTLVLYLIEFEFHFTGDGVWTDQHAHQVENFNNILPDFPESLNKVYKYGVKPAANKTNVVQPQF